MSVIETQQSLDWHYLQNINKQEEEDNREIIMTFIIISILVMYFICTFPAAIIVQVDPNAEIMPKVRITHQNSHRQKSFNTEPKAEFEKLKKYFLGSHSNLYSQLVEWHHSPYFVRSHEFYLQKNSQHSIILMLQFLEATFKYKQIHKNHLIRRQKIKHSLSCHGQIVYSQIFILCKWKIKICKICRLYILY